MSSVSTPLRAFTPKRKLDPENLSNLRAKIIQESKLNQVPIKPRSGIKTNDVLSNEKSLNKSKLPDIEWEHPDLLQIEKRLVNKELESKKIVLNILLFLSSSLIYNYLQLIYKSLIEPSFLIELDFNFKNLLYVVQLICVWNISSGVYKILKPQDQFTDLNLTPVQRDLLGLQQVPTTRNITPPTPLAPTFKVEPTASTAPTAQPQSTVQPTTQAALKKSSTPIASPMSSPSKQFSPRKIVPTAPISQSTQSTKIQALKDELSTPTYIPSPKYYYRMDSPSRSRRRNV